MINIYWRTYNKLYLFPTQLHIHMSSLLETDCSYTFTCSLELTLSFEMATLLNFSTTSLAMKERPRPLCRRCLLTTCRLWASFSSKLAPFSSTPTSLMLPRTAREMQQVLVTTPYHINITIPSTWTVDAGSILPLPLRGMVITLTHWRMLKVLCKKKELHSFGCIYISQYHTLHHSPMLLNTER